jgi:hypothetical protein
MPIPAVTCGSKITLTWGQGGGLYTAALSAVATNSPSTWLWTILYVPVGLEALLSGTWGDFVNGVSTAMNPSLPNIPTDTASGTIVIQCIATNGTGPSVPSTDKGAGQQCIEIGSELLHLIFPGDKEYNWGRVLEATLRKIEADTPLTDYLQAFTTPGPSIVLPNPGSGIYADVPGLEINLTTTIPNEKVLLLFEAAAFRAATLVLLVEFLVDGVEVAAPNASGGFSSPANIGINIGKSSPHTFVATGAHIVKVRTKWTSTYGPSTMNDGTLTIFRGRTP